MVAFSSRVRFWKNFRQFISRMHLDFFSFIFFFFWKWRLCCAHLIPLFRPGSVNSGSASRDDCRRVFPDELRVSSFPDRFPHYACTVAKSAHSDFVGSGVYACLGVTCHLHFCQNDRDLLRATAVTRGWNGHRIRVSTQS